MRKKLNYKKFLSLMLSIVIASQTGCGVDSNNDFNVSFEEIESNLSDEEIEKSFSDNKIVNNSACDKYIEIFDNYNIDYKCDEFLIGKDEINSMYEKLNNGYNCNFKSEDNSYTLYYKIKENSFKYLEEHPNYQSCFNDDLIEKVLMLILEELFNEPIGDITNDICRLQSLKIIYIDDEEEQSTNASFDFEENIIYLYRKNIELMTNMFIEEHELDNDISTFNDVYLKYVYVFLSHEFEHLYHSMCFCCDDEMNNQTILSYNKAEDDKYFVSFLREASAESAIINLSNCTNYNDITFSNSEHAYISFRDIESMFMLLALFNEGVEISDYYNAMRSDDIDNLLNFYDINTDKERESFFRILYVVDGIYGRSSLYEKYVQKYGAIESFEDEVVLKREIGADCIVELYKMVLQKMVKYTKNNSNFTIKKNLLLLSYVKEKIFEIDTIFFINSDFEISIDSNFENKIEVLSDVYLNFLKEYYSVNEYYSVKEFECSDIKLEYLKHVLKSYAKVDGDGYYCSEEDNQIINELLFDFPLLRPISVFHNHSFDFYRIEQDYTETNSLKLVKN